MDLQINVTLIRFGEATYRTGPIAAQQEVPDREERAERIRHEVRRETMPRRSFEFRYDQEPARYGVPLTTG